MARRAMLMPTVWRWLSLSSLSLALSARTGAEPPPGTTPSSTAARVACNESSTRACFSLISTSVAAPTLITATPPVGLATGTSVSRPDDRCFESIREG